VPAPPSNQALPEQEPGTRPARALPYELHVEGEVAFAQGGIELPSAIPAKPEPFFTCVSVTAGARRGLTLWARAIKLQTLFGTIGATSYDLAVYGPNGFLRTFVGGLAPGSANLTVEAIYDRMRRALRL